MNLGAKVAALMLAAAPAGAAECRLALALALDVSSSVDAAEDRLQRSGLAAALIAPEVRAAFLSSPLPVALAVYEWSGRYNQDVLLDWRLIGDEGALVLAAETIGRSRRGTDEFPTAVGYALGFGAGFLARAPDCLFEEGAAVKQASKRIAVGKAQRKLGVRPGIVALVAQFAQTRDDQQG